MGIGLYFTIRTRFVQVRCFAEGWRRLFSREKGEKKGGMKAMGFEINSDMMSMMNGFTVLRLFTLMGGMMNMNFTKEQLLDLNKKLNKIRKPKAKK